MTRTWLGSARADRCFGLTEIFALTPAPARSTARSTTSAFPATSLALMRISFSPSSRRTTSSNSPDGPTVSWRLDIGPAVGDDDAGPGIALAAHRDPFAIDGLVVTRAVDLEGR